MKDDEQSELVEPFETDNDSLTRLSPQYLFAMGAEWEIFRRRLAQGTPFKTLCLAHNRTRFVQMAERSKRFVEDRQTACDGWVEIWVGDLISPKSR
jgi:hypothetical protein